MSQCSLTEDNVVALRRKQPLRPRPQLATAEQEGEADLSLTEV